MAPAAPDDIRAWLEKKGFPLEMRVARELRRVLDYAQVGTYYNDPETETPREIDVVGGKVAAFGDEKSDHTFALDIACECKNNSASPWVCFLSDGRGITPVAPGVRPVLGKTRRLLLAAAKDPSLVSTELIRSRRVGHGLVHMAEKVPDAPFEALMSVAKASSARLAGYQEEATNDPDFHVLIQPLVVISGQLFDAFLNESGTMEVVEVRRTRVLFLRPVKTQRFLLVDIVTESELPTYADELRASFVALVDSIKVAGSRTGKSLGLLDGAV